MKRLVLSIYAVACIFAISCSEREFGVDEDVFDDGIVLTKAQENILKAENAFGMELLKKLYEGDDIIISPYSISAAFSMLANGASGTTYDNIASTLGLKGSADDINEYYKLMTQQMCSADPDVEISIANAFWMNSGFSVKRPFLNALEQNYDSFNKVLEFGTPKAKQEIDGWIERSTNGMMDHLGADIFEDSQFVLSNTIYFNAAWRLNPGVEYLTFTGKKSTSRDVPFFSWASVKCYVDKDVAVCSVPYASGRYSFVAVMPSGSGFDRFMKNLSAEKFANYAGRVSYGGTDHSYILKLPQFDVSTLLRGEDFDKKLEKMGMNNVLSGNYNYSNLSDDLITGLTTIHRAKISVNLNGTEASAVTAITNMSWAPGPEFHQSVVTVVQIDHPFVFAIRENSSGAFIFLGAKVN